MAKATDLMMSPDLLPENGKETSAISFSREKSVNNGTDINSLFAAISDFGMKVM